MASQIAIWQGSLYYTVAQVSVFNWALSNTQKLFPAKCLSFAFSTFMKNAFVLRLSIFTQNALILSNNMIFHCEALYNQCYQRVIPYKSTEKNMTVFFVGFFTKKVKSFRYFSNKIFFKTKFWLFSTTFKSVTRLNPVFQPILTVTIVTVNMGWNTGFSPVTDLEKGCSLLTMLKLNVWQGVCSVVRLDTNIFIGTSVLNCQTLKTLFLQILVIKIICSRKLGGIHFFPSTCGQNMSLYGPILLPKQ